jgi:hypothetical protein
MKVFVYRNLTKNCWSVRDERLGRVVLHTRRLVLADATFVVQKAGRERVLREKRKNVHAGIRGTLVRRGKLGPQFRNSCIEASYNPYKAETFTAPDGTPIVGTFGRVELAFPKVYAQSHYGKLFGAGAHLWDSDEDFDAFVRSIDSDGKD